MKITVVCAAGRQGAMLVKEALSRGHEVTAVARRVQNLPKGVKTIEKDLFDLVLDDLKASDVVIDAFGAWTEDTLPQHSRSLKHMCDILSGTAIRLLVVGAAGSLYMNPEHTLTLAETPDFPDIYKGVAAASARALAELRGRKDVKWTYLSPAADFQPDGVRTGKYLLAGEELTPNSKGESVISYADYAIAMLDEAEQGKNIQKRVSVVSQ